VCDTCPRPAPNHTARVSVPQLIRAVLVYACASVYPPELTSGFCPEDAVATTFEPLRDLELLVLARALSRPPPHAGRVLGSGGDCGASGDSSNERFWVSKSWCRSALRWLEHHERTREEETAARRANARAGGKKKKKKEARKQRRRSGASGPRPPPPGPDVNGDITCKHGALVPASRTRGGTGARGGRMVDRGTWRALHTLYPASTILCGAVAPSAGSGDGSCPLCLDEEDRNRREATRSAEREKKTRRAPLSDDLVRNVYTRKSGGVPVHRLVGETNAGRCPLAPGIYHAVPRSWCRRWRTYMRAGGERPEAPTGDSLLCDAHKLPLVPNHLEAYLCGRSPTLFGGEEGEWLDRENLVVAEVLTEEEGAALGALWKNTHTSFSMKFALTTEGTNTDITWSTTPCRKCDAGHCGVDIAVRNRNRGRCKDY